MKNRAKNKTIQNTSALAAQLQSENESKWSDYAIKILLLAFGIWMSVYFFGFLASPNSDFPCFTQVARELLSFHQPSSYKRVPVHGFLVVLISIFTQSSPHPDLTAGWAVCAILYPLTIVLIYIVGKQLIGRSAIWPALISAVNPWYIQSLVDPIAEMSLLFFILLTFYFLFKRSGWVYLFASITSMVRYEGAALILAAFVWDMIEAKDWRRRGRAFALSAAACVPLMLWEAGTIINWRQEGGHYLNEMGEASGGKFVFFGFINMLWESGFSLLFLPVKGASQDTTNFLIRINGILLALSFGFGTVYGLIKRNWKVLMLLIFLLPYICIHAAHSFLMQRFGVPVNWLILLVSMYGFYSLYHIINKDNRMPRLLIITVQAIAVVIFVTWFVGLYPYLAYSAALSKHSVPIPYVVLSIVVIFSAIRAYLHRLKFLGADILVVAIMAVVVVSNQYAVAYRLGNGDLDIEFKYLAQWYRANAKPGELLVTTLPGNCALYDPAHTSSYIHTSSIDANTPDEFTAVCYRKNITYVVWDSRAGSAKGSRYYNLWHLANTDRLSAGRNIGPYEFITTLKGSTSYSPARVIHIYRLKKPAS
jgi:hypothetical protein